MIVFLGGSWNHGGIIGEVGRGREVERISRKTSRRKTAVTHLALVDKAFSTDLDVRVRTTIEFSFGEVV